MRAVDPPRPEEIARARARIQDVVLRTPLVPLDLPDAPARIHLKLECLQPIGSFKLRGATNAMRSADPKRLLRGVYTASAGNMAQGVAWGARAMGIPCTAIVPEQAPKTKLDAIERLGARIVKVPFETWWRVMEEHGYPGMEGLFIHPVADPAVIAGNGTIGLEIMEDLPDTEAILVPYGGGGRSGERPGVGRGSGGSGGGTSTGRSSGRSGGARFPPRATRPSRARARRRSPPPPGIPRAPARTATT